MCHLMFFLQTTRGSVTIPESQLDEKVLLINQ